MLRLTNIGLNNASRSINNQRIIKSVMGLRYNSKKSKKDNQQMDLSQIPIKSVGAIVDFYIPPPIFSCPIKSWPNLILRRMGLFVINTYSVVKYKQDTKLKLKFYDWKEDAMQKFVKANKVFASGCNLPASKRSDYIKMQLENNTGSLVQKKLIERAKTFPISGKLSWDLVKVVKNPKIVSFMVIPDGNNIATFIQFVMKVRTKQKVSFNDGTNNKETERVVDDYLVYTLNPYTDELVLVGTVFESDHLRNLQGETSQSMKLMNAFQDRCADIFRSNPNKD